MWLRRWQTGCGRERAVRSAAKVLQSSSRPTQLATQRKRRVEQQQPASQNHTSAAPVTQARASCEQPGARIKMKVLVSPHRHFSAASQLWFPHACHNNPVCPVFLFTESARPLSRTPVLQSVAVTARAGTLDPTGYALRGTIAATRCVCVRAAGGPLWKGPVGVPFFARCRNHCGCMSA